MKKERKYHFGFILAAAIIFQLNLSAQPIASVELENAVSIQANVCAVFKSDRTMWVYPPGDPDNVIELQVGDDVRNYEQLEVGDVITVTYYESAAVYLTPPGDLPDENTSTVVARTDKGDKPGGIVVEVYDISAMVTNFDSDSGLITLTGPRGNSLTTVVSEEVAASGLIKAGEMVHVRYTQNLAIVVEPFNN